MQGAAGAALFDPYGIDPTDPDTILVVDGDHVLRDSDEVTAIYTGLASPWRLQSWIIASSALRDAADMIDPQYPGFISAEPLKYLLRPYHRQ